jgi:hypothetical protein
MQQGLIQGLPYSYRLSILASTPFLFLTTGLYGDIDQRFGIPANSNTMTLSAYSDSRSIEPSPLTQ